MKIDGNHIIAEKGKVFKRKSTGEYFGAEIYLGYSYYIGGILQDPPHLDKPEDFEEVDDLSTLTDKEALEIITGHNYE